MKRADDLSAMLRGEVITDLEWRAGLDNLFARVPLEDLLAGLDFKALQASAGFAEKGVATARVKLPDGAVRPVSFFPKFFALGKDRAIIPHGHDNMVSAHLVLGGKLRLRQYDQIERTPTEMLVRPRTDRIASAGDLSSIGLVEENVHWFIAEEASFTLDTIVTGIVEGADPSYDIFNLDMDAARAVSGGDLWAPRLSVDAALEKYG